MPHTGKTAIMGNLGMTVTIVLMATLSAQPCSLSTMVAGNRIIDLCHLNKSLTKISNALLYAEQYVQSISNKVEFLSYKGR